VLAASPTVRRCHTSGGRIFAESHATALSPRPVYQQDLEAAKGVAGVITIGSNLPSPTGDDEEYGVGQSFAEKLLMQVQLQRARMCSAWRCLRCVCGLHPTLTPHPRALQSVVSKSQFLEHLRCVDAADSFFARRPSNSDLSHNNTRSSSPVQKGNAIT